MIYLLPAGNTFAIYPVKPDVEGVIEIDQLPEGEGILKRNEQGEFYFERFPEVVNPPIIEPPIEPDPPQVHESLEDKVTRLEALIEQQKQQNLTILDVNLTLYEEILALRDEVAQLKGNMNV